MEIRSGTARSGDLDIYYEDMGDPSDPPVLLIMGLGAQLLLWRDGFCEKLVAQGLRVIRYDNRDVGLSSKTERRSSAGPLIPRLLKFWLGLPSKPTTARGHGRRRRRGARSPRDRPRPHRRRLDGRHDRPGLRRTVPRSGPAPWR